MIELYLYFGYTFMRDYLHNRVKLRTLERPFDSQGTWLNYWHEIKVTVGGVTTLG
jgi:hypothetical protein